MEILIEVSNGGGPGTPGPGVINYSGVPMRQLLDNRYKKYRHIGEEGKFWREKVRSGISDMFGLLAYAVSKMEKSNRKSKSADGTSRRRLEKGKIPVSGGPKRVERD